MVDDIANSDSTIALDCIEQSMAYQGEAKLKTLKMPLYLINSSANPTDTLAFRKNSIAYRFFNVGKTGHYPMLEKPEKFNALLAEVIDEMKITKK